MDFSLKERFSKENIGKVIYNYWGKKTIKQINENRQGEASNKSYFIERFIGGSLQKMFQ